MLNEEPVHERDRMIVAMLKPLGIDLADPEFWQKGYDFVEELLKELRGLVEGR